MRPTRLADYSYYCQFTSASLRPWVPSNHVTVSIREPIGTTFTSNVSQIIGGQPFTGTCHLENLANANDRSYSVQFWNTKGLLGTYFVYAPKQTLVPSQPFVLFRTTEQEESNAVVVTSGAHSAYPTFGIQITSYDASQIFWCSLRDERQLEYRSNIWPAPAVTFTTNVSVHQNGIPFAGRCSVTEFPPADTTYSVGFYAGQTGLLATYVVQPNKSLNLIIKGHHPNVLVSQGASLQLPTFELFINVTGSPSQPFWCELQIGQAMQYKSNKVIL